MEEYNKIKVAMVCHFSNSNVRKHLQFTNKRLYAFCRLLLGLPPKDLSDGDVAAWDTYMIELLRKRKDIDLTVISAHSGLRRRLTSFEMDGVHYHFVRIEESMLLKRMISSPSLWHRLNPMRPIVRRIISKTQPDIIALIGAENGYISGSVLGIENIPLIVKCQTIYNNPDRGKYARVDAKYAYVEKLIFKDLQYVAVGTEMHRKLFRQINTKAYNFKWALGNLLPDVKPVRREYDFVNYAMGMSDKKGYSDSIKALSIVKKHHPNVKLNLVGRVTDEYKEKLDSLISSSGLKDNVIYTSFFERQEDLFQHIQKAQFALLPCKMDSVSSTIRQAMHYGLPVVCYETEGTHRLNQEKECVLIAKNGNVEDLAAKMLVLLDDKERMMTLRLNAKEFSRRWNDDDGNVRQMAANFHAVVEHYRNGAPIPQELLYEEPSLF